MSRNAGSDENGRFDEILLTNLTKFLFLWKFAHKLRFNGLEGPRKSWRIWQNLLFGESDNFWRNLVKVVDAMIRVNILT